jgi:hypothetical protein
VNSGSATLASLGAKLAVSTSRCDREFTRRREANSALLPCSMVETTWLAHLHGPAKPARINSSEASRRRTVLDANLLVNSQQFHSLWMLLVPEKSDNCSDSTG